MLCRESYGDFPAIFTPFYRYLARLHLALRWERSFEDSREVSGMAELSGQGKQDHRSIPGADHFNF